MTNIETWRYQYRDNYQAARYLLANEAQGFAIDATTYGTGEAIAAYTGGPVGGTVTVKSASDAGDILISKSLDASNLVQSGTSPKMVLWSSAPYVRWTPHNIFLASQGFNASGQWTGNNSTITDNNTTAPDGTPTASKIDATSTTNAYMYHSNLQLIADAVYTFSAYLKQGTNTWAHLNIGGAVGNIGQYFDLANGAVGTGGGGSGAGFVLVSAAITSVGSGWYRCSITGSLSTATNRVPFIQIASGDGNTTVVSGDDIYAWGAQMVRGHNPNPYLVTTTTARIGIPQEYDTAASKFGILVEPAATNLLTNSEAAGSWTGITQASISANATTAPDGSSTADKLVEDGTNNLHYTINDGTVSSGASYTASVFVKAAERTWCAVTVDGVGSSGIYVNLSTGAVGTVQASNTGYSVTSVGNGWYRVAVTAVTTSTTAGVAVFLATADNTASYAGDGSSGIYIWGSQIETGTIATSYIPTIGGTSTRAKDDINVSLTSVPYNLSAVSAYQWQKIVGDGGFGTMFFGLNDGTSNNDIEVYKGAVGTAGINFDAYSGGAPQMGKSTGSIALGQSFKAGIRVATNDGIGVVDGTLTTQDTTLTMPVSPTTINIGRWAVSDGYYGVVRLYQLVVLPRAMTDGQLQTVTT